MLAPLSRFSGLEPSVVQPHHRITASLRDVEARVCGLESKVLDEYGCEPKSNRPGPDITIPRRGQRGAGALESLT